MKKFKIFFPTILFLSLLLTNVSFALDLYDDFSGTYIDKNKWRQTDWVREIDPGSQKLLIKQASPSPITISTYPYHDNNNLNFSDPNSVNSIQADLTILQNNITNNAFTGPWLVGRWYNDGTPGGGQFPLRSTSNGEQVATTMTSDLPGDSFEGTILNTCKWVNGSWNGAQIRQDNELIVSTSPDYSASGAKVYTQYQLMGDFDVQVDFRVGLGWTDPITPSGTDPHLDAAAMGIFVDEPHWIHITRIINPDGNTLSLYSNIPGQGMLASVANDATSGKYRIVRKGSNITFKYDTGKGWQDLHTISAFSLSVYIFLYAGSVDTQHAFTTYFDNFLINSGATSYAPLVWNDQFQRRPDFYVGGVVCDYLGARVWGQYWKQLDPLQTLKENGFTWARVGVLTTSSQSLRWSSLEYAEQILREASEKGLRLNLFFFLSDKAAHAGQQDAPPEWVGLSVTDTAKALETYTYSTTQYFLNRGLNIELYDIGNEIERGILNFRPGERIALPPGVDVTTNMDYMRNNVWNIEATLLKSAISGVKRADPDAKIVLHISGLGMSPGDLFVKSFFQAMIDEGVEFDYAGLSHPYPFTGWSLPNYSTYCWFQRLQETIDFLGSLSKKVIFNEAGYPHDSAGIEGKPMEDFPYTPTGQAAWVRNQLRFTSNSENVIGFFYFYPEWFPGMSADPSTLNLQSTGLFASDTQVEPAMEEFRVNLGPPTPLSALTVIKAGTGSGTVTSSPSGIYCGTHCTETYNNGTSVILTATAESGSAFIGWSGGGCSGTGTCTLTMNANTTVTATFALSTSSQYTLTVNKSGTGTGTVTSSPAGINCGSDCSEAYNQGTNVTLTAAPSSGSTFIGWSGGGCSGAGTCTLTMNANTTVTATFALSTSSQYTLTVNKSGTGTGTVTSSPAGINCGSTCTEDVKAGTKITLKAKVDTNSTFTGWSGGGCSGTGTCVVMMNADTAVTAAFSAKVSPPVISVSPSSINFGNVNLGSTSENTVTIQNNGISDLAISSINIGGTNASDFTQTDNCTTIPKGNSCTITVTFAPTSVGKKSGTINISSNDPKKPTVNVKLSGTGKSSPCTYSISASSEQFEGPGGTGSVNVIAPTGCPWSAKSNAGWITITSGSSGGGNGAVAYTVGNNSSTTQRTGTMAIAGQTFTVTQSPNPPPPTQKPNLTPYKPQGWSDSIVVTNKTGCTSTSCTDSSPLLPTDTLYVDWAVINNGAVATSATFYTQLYVDGALKQTWSTSSSVNPNYYVSINDYSIGSLSAETHTIKVMADSTNVIDESNKNDNSYTKTISVTQSGGPCPTPGTPSSPSPSNGATGVSTSLTLSWGATSNTDSYDVYFGTSSNPPYVGNTASTSYPRSGLSNSTTYYWKIVAKKNCSSTTNSTPGPVWSFSTNSLPQPTLVSITVAPANTSIATGATQQFTATGTYSDNTTKNITSSVTWSSSNTGIATISNAGLATSIAAGSTIITATSGSISGSTTLTVAASSTWAISTVASYGYLGGTGLVAAGYTSIAVDKSDNPHISYLYYIDELNTEVKYAKWNGTQWVLTTVDLGGTGGGSLKLDANGYPHIAYTGDTIYNVAYWTNLRYAYWNGASWSVKIVDVAPETWGYFIGGEASLALDASGYAHIAYYAYGGSIEETLKYAHGKDLSWTTNTVNSTGRVWENSIAIDANGYPHIAYSAYGVETEGTLKYARWTGSSWVIQTVDINGGYPSIAIDSNGHPHISYNGLHGGAITLKYARWTGSSWDIQIIDNSADAHTSIALDANNNPHIAYTDSGMYDGMNYVYWTGTQWVFKNVEGNIYVNYPSIALSPVTGRPHISYYDMGEHLLKYAVMQ